MVKKSSCNVEEREKSEDSILNEVDLDNYYSLLAENQLLQNTIQIKIEEISILKERIGLLKLDLERNQGQQSQKGSIEEIKIVRQYSSPDYNKAEKSSKNHLKSPQKRSMNIEDASEVCEFRQASQIRAYDNRKADQEV